jgi:hypothetical protein
MQPDKYTSKKVQKALLAADFSMLCQLKWQSIEYDAWNILNDARATTTLVYAQNTSFHGAYSWQLFEMRNDNTCWLVKQVWEMKQDRQRFEELKKQMIEITNLPATYDLFNDMHKEQIRNFYSIPFIPSISIQKFPVEVATYQKYFQFVQTLSLPIYCELNSGLDGTTHTFAVKKAITNLGITYTWVYFPKEWETLQPLLDFMMSY